jgi:hypothetical protein
LIQAEKKLQHVCAIKSVKQCVLRGYSVGVTDRGGFTKYAVEMASGGMMYIPSIMTIRSGIQVTLEL